MENNYRLFFGLALDVLIRPWEKLVLSQKYNEVLTAHWGAARVPSRNLFLIHLPSAARCNSFRSRFTSDHHLSLLANRLWRRARKICATPADRNASQPRLCASPFFLTLSPSYMIFLMVGDLFRAKQEEGVDEFYNGSGITWKLSEQEARAVAGLRV
jgi:conserved oligomeric Golgi complex subunit 4